VEFGQIYRRKLWALHMGVVCPSIPCGPLIKMHIKTRIAVTTVPIFSFKVSVRVRMNLCG